MLGTRRHLPPHPRLYIDRPLHDRHTRSCAHFERRFSDSPPASCISVSSQANLVISTNIGGKTVACDERSLAGVGSVDHR